MACGMADVTPLPISVAASSWCSGTPADLCRLADGESLAGQAIQSAGRHNQEVGTIGVVPTSAQRRLSAIAWGWVSGICRRYVRGH
jgi:hypothetical protein